MGKRMFVAGAALTAVLLIPSIVAAQTAGPPTRAEFDELKKRLDETQTTVVAMEKKYRSDFEAVKSRLSATEGDVGELRKDFERLKEQYKETDTIVGQISKAIVENGEMRRVPNIAGNMKYSSFKSDLTGAVHDVMQQTGTLRLSNRMLTTQTVRVVYADRTIEYTIAPGQYQDVSVGVGTITTQLGGGFEGPRNWTIAPPSYFQEVDIVPRADTSWVAVEPPLRIVGPPPWISTPIGSPIFYDSVRY